MQKRAWIVGALGLAGLAGCTSLLGDFEIAPSEAGDDAGADGSLAVDAQPPSSVDGNVGTHDAADAGHDAAGPDTGPGTCPTGFKTCAGFCVSFDDPAYGCTPTSCAPCSIPNAVSKCLAGACAFDSCVSGFADCDVDAGDGCETNTNIDPAHCGKCATSCSTTGGTPNCAGGQCSSVACAPNHADCDKDAGDGCEVTTNSDTKNCGTCGHFCGTAQASAVTCNGACVFACNAPYAHCPASLDSAGCDVNTSSDPKNCKTCGNVCAAGQACVGSACSCTATSCASGCCGNNSCTAAPSVTACGYGGAACVDCSASVQNALGTRCDATTKHCGYSSCVAGWLDADNDPSNGCESLSPTSVSEAAGSLVGWWIADTGLSTGGGLSQWADQSGKGHPAVCTSGCPSAVAGGLQGHATFAFNGSTQFFQISGNFPFAGSGLTWFIVWAPSTTGGQYEPLLSFNTTASQDASRLEISHGGGDTNILYSVCDSGTCPGWGAGIWTTGWHAMVINHAASGVVTYSNNQGNPGGFGFNGAGSTVTLPAGQGRATNYIGLDTYSRYFQGQMAEILVFQTSVSASSQASIEQYLKNKYGY